ncbi:hypothetical protein JXO59_04695 [candidate division KSB1 bacterium]|nr:hypothetical protein [candidate division KSB1 bacterium]
MVSRAHGQSFRTPVMPVENIKPGMTGVGKTIFYGDKIEEFGVEVLDIMRNIYPQRDLIVVRLTGDKAEKWGVVSGMSGSPVYINGKLVGALAMRLGDFQKEPIAGVTPFADMVQAAEMDSRRKEISTSSASLMHTYLQSVFIPSDEWFWNNWIDNNRPVISRTDPSLRPIEAPLILSGFSDQVLSSSRPVLSSLGFMPVAAGSAGDTPFRADVGLEPGSAISQVFITGDLGIDATGTLTAIEDSKILAFGHYIFNLGPINLPLGRSHIIATLPSYFDAKKIAMTKEIIGIARQDRLSGIYGELGRQPAWIPVRVHLQAEDNPLRTFQFRLASDRSINNIMPFFFRTALFQALVAGKLAADPCTIELTGKISFDDGQTLNFSDFFSYEQRLGFLGAGSEAAQAADFTAKIMGLLMVNDFSPPTMTDIEVKAVIRSGEHLARLRSMHLDRLEANPGDSLLLTLKLRRTDGREINYHHTIKLPVNLQAKYVTLFAGGSAALILNEIRKNPDKYRPASFKHLLAIIEKRRKGNTLYIQVREPAAGMTIEGEELNALPPSIMNIMDGRTGGKYLRDRVLSEEAILTDQEITGLQKINLRIIQSPSVAKKKDNSEKTTIFDW